MQEEMRKRVGNLSDTLHIIWTQRKSVLNGTAGINIHTNIQVCQISMKLIRQDQNKLFIPQQYTALIKMYIS